jgi:hypothetical protein
VKVLTVNVYIQLYDSIVERINKKLSRKSREEKMGLDLGNCPRRSPTEYACGPSRGALFALWEGALKGAEIGPFGSPRRWGPEASLGALIHSPSPDWWLISSPVDVSLSSASR